MPKVIIQPGHKRPFPWIGFGTGTAGEADYAVRVAAALINEFAVRGWNTVVVPAAFNYAIEADIFISLHCDGVRNTTARGFSIGWHDGLHNADSSKHIAYQLEREYKKLGIPFRGFNISTNESHYYAFKRLVNTKAAMLLEMGFLTNPQDKSFLENNVNLVAKTITDGIAGQRLSEVILDPNRIVLRIFKDGKETDSRKAKDFVLTASKFYSSGVAAYQYDKGIGFFRIDDHGKIVRENGFLSGGTLAHREKPGLLTVTADGFQAYGYA